MINSKLSNCIRGLALLSVAVGAHAEVAYVTDKLQLGVHQAEDTSDRAFEFLKSADQVEILEQDRFYARVKISDGREGWVRKTYLVAEPPALLRVAQAEKERDEAALELKRLQDRLGQEKSRRSELEKKVASSEAKTESEQDELDELRTVNGELQERLDSYAFSVPGAWFLVLTIACIFAGFVSGWWWLDRRSRMRHGGIRLY